MEAIGNTAPISRHVDHVTSIKNAVTEQVVELETCTVDRPVVLALNEVLV